MKAMLDARIVAARTQGPVALPHGEAAIREIITASSQGGFM
jgi:hypothetical protein